MFGIETTVEDKREIRRMWQEGLSAAHIATYVDSDPQTIRRLCQDLPRHEPKIPLTNQQITELLQTWPRISDSPT
jgi:hypothetical protein